VLRGERAALARAITLVESSREEHRELATELVEACLPHSGDSIRLGITGVPGVGKSTFIEAFGLMLAEGGERVAVLAVDPTSPRSGGSILGDKTRMARLSVHPNAYIRPSPSRGSLGGVTRRTREAIILCEAAGFRRVIVETVGVGQSEVAVRSMTDFFLLLLLANAGDELQGLKRGIIEMCDLIAINKADGGQKRAAEQARRQFENALSYLPPASSGWQPPVVTCSALEGRGLEEIWRQILVFQQLTASNGTWDGRRATQRREWFEQAIYEEMTRRWLSDEGWQARWKKAKARVESGETSPARAARWIFDGD
jgi:LAO/AO transport system kinase